MSKTSISKPRAKTESASRKSKRVTFETARQIALALPGVEEGLSNGAPVLRVRGKFLARLMEDGDSLLINVDLFKRDILINAEPATFYVTDFYRCHQKMFVRLSKIDRKVLAELLEQAWRSAAPKRAVEAYDSK